MNKQRKWILVMTAVGLLGTATAAGAAGVVEKVSGLLRKDIVVSINGEDTSLKPVYIKGVAYLPARDAANALGYEVNWNAKEKEIELNAPEEAADYINVDGVVASVNTTDGKTSIEVLGRGEGHNDWVILHVDEKTILVDASGNPVKADQLKAGMHITAEYGPMVALSYPAQSTAHRIVVEEQRLVREAEIGQIERSDEGWRLSFGANSGTEFQADLVLNFGKETMVINTQGQSVDVEDLQAGMKVRTYYGPIMTKSLPPQSPAHIVVVLSDVIPSAEKPQYREAAWKSLSEEVRKTVTTKQDEAVVQYMPAVNVTVLNASEEGKKLLDAIKANKGNVVAVTYDTTQNQLIGPAVVILDPATLQPIGLLPRK